MSELCLVPVICKNLVRSVSPKSMIIQILDLRVVRALLSLIKKEVNSSILDRNGNGDQTRDLLCGCEFGQTIIPT